ncbi:MAG TPA: DUF4340 domain-containing protein [Chitinophagales bacterium]|nr:DUF4340 domain-containing protein [Chitinophagales bacterium]
MSKFSNTKLLLILVALAAVIAIVKYLDVSKGERNFRSELVKIDTAKISSIYIYPKSKKGQEVKLFRENGQWKVRVNENKNQNVDYSRISGLFKTITGIKPVRLAARNMEKWKDFEVDTSGTRVKVHEGDKKTLDIIIGKMNFIGGRDVETFVRLDNETETYAVSGFLDATFNTGIDEWRDKTLIKNGKDKWLKLAFALADTMRFQLEKQDTVWILDGMPANQTEVNNYLSSVSHVMGTAFADDLDASTLGSAQYLLEIEDTTGSKIKVEGFVVGDKKILRSSLNTDNLINGSQGGVFERIFVSRQKFMPPADTAASP